MDIKYYVKKYKEHEAQRLSTNKRNKFWAKYNETKKTDPETGFDMNKF